MTSNTTHTTSTDLSSRSTFQLQTPPPRLQSHRCHHMPSISSPTSHSTTSQIPTNMSMTNTSRPHIITRRLYRHHHHHRHLRRRCRLPARKNSRGRLSSRGTFPPTPARIPLHPPRLPPRLLRIPPHPLSMARQPRGPRGILPRTRRSARTAAYPTRRSVVCAS